MLRLHDDEAKLRVSLLCRDQQIDVLKHATTGFVENEVSQNLVFGYPACLLPQGIPWRWGYAADDDIADFLAVWEMVAGGAALAA